ncbi:MAG TPA: hypothetical protein VHV57_13845 [Acidimicrobiales bacterium]|jgi:hypothetical protein|nr:hypothetical protein [Acidimicrobiales bacterium]
MSFDEAYANMVHDEFRAAPGNGVSGGAAHAAPSEAVQATRTRTIALVASGGIACAVVGALLGGLGGEFGISPASAHALNSSSETVPLSSVANAAFVSHAAAAAPALASGISIGSLTNGVTGGTTHGSGSVASTLASAVGGLLGGTSPFIPPAVDPAAPMTGDPVTTTSGSNTPSVQAAVSDVTLGLNQVLGNLTKALAAVVSMPSNPAAGITDVVSTLSDTLGDITNTLSNLTTDLPTPSGLNLGSLPIVSALAPGTAKAPAASGAGVPSGLKALAPVVAAVNGLIPSTGSGTPSLPSLPTVPLPGLSTASTPSLPTTSTLALPDLPPLNLPTLPGSSSGTSGGVTIPVPLPSGVNLSVHPTIGPISVGVTIGSSGITVSAG